MRRNDQASNKNALGPFAEKVALLLAMIGAAAAAWILRGVLLILFGAIVLAIGMGAIAKLLANKFRIGYAAGLSIVVLIGLILIGAIGWFLGAAIGEQLDELAQKIPTGVQWLNDQIDTRPYARDLMAKLQTADLSGRPDGSPVRLPPRCDCRWRLPDRLSLWPSLRSIWQRSRDATGTAFSVCCLPRRNHAYQDYSMRQLTFSAAGSPANWS